MRKVWVKAKRRIFIDTKYSRAGCMIENKYFTFQPFKRNSHNELLEKQLKTIIMSITIAIKNMFQPFKRNISFCVWPSGTPCLAPRAYKACMGRFSNRYGTVLKVFPHLGTRTNPCGLGFPKRTMSWVYAGKSPTFKSRVAEWYTMPCSKGL